MCQFHAKYFLSFILLFSISNSFGQTSTESNPLSGRENDPYSKYGIGEILIGNNTVLRGMGNITSAYESPYTINSDNPASYSFLKLTTYEAGAQASYRSIATDNSTNSSGTATLAYLNIGVPVGKKAGLCFGFRPSSHVYYNLADTGHTALSDSTVNNYLGSGGLNYAYVGAAYQFKGLSLGFNFGYMFGNIATSTVLTSLDTGKVYNSYFVKQTDIGGIYWKVGAMYEKALRKDLTIRVGGTFTLQQDLNVTRNETWYGEYPFYDTIVKDTAYYSGQSSSRLTMPTSYSIGVQLAKTDKWNVGIDYSGTQWTQFRTGFNDTAATSLANTYKISLGGELTPNAQNLRNYWARVTYRFGLYYGTNYVRIQNTELNFYGITFGGSLPFKRSFSHLHASFDIGKLGTKEHGLIQETFVKFTLGLSFNDKWFIKRKYE